MNARTMLAVLALAVSILTGPVMAQENTLVDGQVTKVDDGAQKITIRHGPLKQFGMDDPMTMVFRAGDPEMLKAVKAGDKVKFLPERINGQFTVTKIEKAK